MSIESTIRRSCVQDAVYWGDPVNDGYGGMVFDNPVQIKCRWEDKDQVQLDNDGKEMLSNAEVYVLEDFTNEGYLYLGKLTDLTMAQRSDPKQLDGAFEIIKFSKIPVFGSTTKFIRKIYLSWRGAN